MTLEKTFNIPLERLDHLSAKKKNSCGRFFPLSFCLDLEYFGIALCVVAMSFGAASIIKHVQKSVSGVVNKT